MEILAASLDPALNDFGEILKLFQEGLEEKKKEQNPGHFPPARRTEPCRAWKPSSGS